MPGVDRFVTRGQPAAMAAVAGMLRAGIPHAVLLTGPPGVGKRTLALDIAAALLCRDPDPAERPCRACRGCRAVEHGNHPDLHRLEPGGAGWAIRIGGREERGVRNLAADLALHPVEGGARVALVVSADRMTEDAQSAFLKTLEEPPARTVIILTAADEERLLPTIRSRSVRLRLGPVPRREVERLLVDSGLADAPVAARLARLTRGRPGHAVALAGTPEALTIRGEIGRSILDLAIASRTDRLRGVRDLLARASQLGATRARGNGSATTGRGGRGRRAASAPSAPATAAPTPASSAAADAETGPAGADDGRLQPGDTSATVAGTPVSVPAAERRAAALALVGIWRDVARDLILVGLGEPGEVAQIDLLDDLETASARLEPAFAATQLRGLELAGERLEGNVSPELVLDAVALGWAA